MSVNIKIEKQHYVDVTRQAERTEWDADDIAHEYTIDGYSVVKKNEFYDFILDEDPKGKTLYFVYAVYDTGDSFHREDNVMCEVGLYEHEEDAQAVMVALEKDYKDSKTRELFDPIEVALPRRGIVETVATSTWKGHFERLREICIEPVSDVSTRRVKFS